MEEGIGLLRWYASFESCEARLCAESLSFAFPRAVPWNVHICMLFTSRRDSFGGVLTSHQNRLMLATYWELATGKGLLCGCGMWNTGGTFGIAGHMLVCFTVSDRSLRLCLHSFFFWFFKLDHFSWCSLKFTDSYICFAVVSKEFFHSIIFLASEFVFDSLYKLLFLSYSLWDIAPLVDLFHVIVYGFI